MIPKCIHFCWFSDEEFSDEIKMCIESWKKVMPEYTIKKWDNTNFDFTINPYVQEAFANKKWAFVSDYVRLYALYNEGGIYLDADIECMKSFNPLLENRAFTGFETKGQVAAWIFGSEKGNPIFREFLDYYEGRHFIVNGKMDLTPNPIPISAVCKKHGMRENDEIQKLENITIYPKRFFCGKDMVTGEINVTPDTYTIHHFDGAWLDEQTRERMELTKYYARKYGKVLPQSSAVLFAKCVSRFKVYGFWGGICSVVEKFIEITFKR